MKTKASLPLIILILALSFRGGCQILEQQKLPYPSVSDQRAALSAKKTATPYRALDSLQIVTDLTFLASNECEGRRPGTAGHAKAMERVALRLRASGIDSFGSSLIQKFTGKTLNGTNEGNNFIGWVKGTKYTDSFIVISAHYDHVGKSSSGAIYHGADDNASGAACLLAMAKYFRQHPHTYSLIFACFDREESGLEGAYAFVEQSKNSGLLKKIKFNLNMDMIARSDKKEIFATGTKYHPWFKSIVDEVQPRTNVNLLMGHDYGSSTNDWTSQSDHYAFHKQQIPFIYLGVEDHPDYHKPTDTVDRINLSRYIENCNLALLITQQLFK